MSEADIDKYLKNIYYDLKSPGSFGGIDTLYKYVKSDDKYRVTRTQIQRFLDHQKIYTDHAKKPHRPKKFAKIYASPGTADLDVGYFHIKRSKYKYILGAVDQFNRKTSLKPLLSLKSRHIIPALLEIIRDLDVKQFRHDKGSYISFF